jgi:hypothetical protein
MLVPIAFRCDQASESRLLTTALVIYSAPCSEHWSRSDRSLKNEPSIDGPRPTAWCSAAASAPRNAIKNPTISRAQRSAGTMCSASGRPPSGCRPHAPTTPAHSHALHDGRSVGTRPIWNHARHNGPRSVPRPAHDHTAHNELSAQRAFVPREAQRALSTTGVRATRCTTSAGTTELA